MFRLAVLLALLQAGATQVPPRDPAAVQKPGTASIRGRITDLETGRPIARAVVTLSSSQPPLSMETASDPDGRYAFAELAAGEYVIRAGPATLHATHVPAYLGLPAAAGLGGRPPRFPLKPGEVRDGADIALVRALAIEGRVVDRSGEPMSGVEVRAVNIRTDRGTPSCSTDDLGGFRLFGLPPGTYRVCAVANGPDPQPYDEGEREVRTCAPSATSDSQADTIVLRREVSGVEIRVQRQRTFSVSGSVVDSAGAAVSGYVGVINLDERGRGAWTEAVDGQFVAKGLLPGQYVVQTTIRGPANPGDTSPHPDAEMGSATIQIDSGDVSGVTVTTAHAANLGGHVVLEGRAPPSPAALHMAVSVRYNDRSRFAYSSRQPVGPVTPDLRFVLNGLFGRNTLGVQNLPDGWIVKSVRYRGVDVTDLPTAFAPGTDTRAIEIVLTDRGADVAARVVDAAGRPQTDAAVVLFPVDPARWTGTVTAPDMQVVKDDVIQTGLHRAGDYYVVAIGSDDAARLWTMRERGFEVLSKVASKITLAESEHRTLKLKLADLEAPR
jgi:Carboxypeptidase regulatory-like domain